MSVYEGLTSEITFGIHVNTKMNSFEVSDEVIFKASGSKGRVTHIGMFTGCIYVRWHDFPNQLSTPCYPESLVKDMYEDELF